MSLPVLCLLCLSKHMAAALTEMLPMTDGVKLHTVVDLELTRGHPAVSIMDRSPYGSFEIELLATLWGAVLDFASVRQDMRGTKQSQGNFTIWHHDTSDAHDTMTWIANSSWTNDEIYMIGGSADGISVYVVYKDPHPAFTRSFIIWSTATGYPIMFPGGAFRKSLMEFWMAATVNNAAECVEEMKSQEDPRGDWWAPITCYPEDFARVKAPVVLWAGWYDIFLLGNLIAYQGLRTMSEPSVRDQHYIVIDPCGHCQDAGSVFTHKTIMGRTLLPVYLSLYNFAKKPMPTSIKRVTFYVMGSHPHTATDKGNYWTSLDEFPSYALTAKYLNADGTISDDAAVSQSTLSYKFDPTNPVQSMGGNNLEVKCGPVDQRPVEQHTSNRTDVLTFTSPVLLTAMALTGPLTVRLFVESDAVDTDFTAKLTDVGPSGSSLLVQDGILRMRWRTPDQGFVMMHAGKIYEVELNLWNTSYVFNKGHALRVSVSSSNFPRYDANPNNGLSLMQRGPNITATNTIHFGKATPSALLLPLVQLSELPEVDVHTIRPPTITEEQEKHILTGVVKAFTPPFA